MNNQEAKLILEAYRLGGQDAEDPQFQEALEQLKRDPELAAWHTAERAIETRVQSKVRAAVKPPAQLKATLLAQRKIVRPQPWWRQPAWFALAAAACLALLATIWTVWPKPRGQTEFAQYRSSMAGTKIERLDLMSRDLTEVRHWLTQTNAHGEFIMPAGLTGKSSLGCKLLEWKGQKVSLICFEMGNRQVAHLLVIDRKAFDQPPADTPQFAQIGDVATLSWSRGDKVYLMASKHTSEQDLRKLL